MENQPKIDDNSESVEKGVDIVTDIMTIEKKMIRLTTVLERD
jgi:primase-polymerase (primpol)-like protein